MKTIKEPEDKLQPQLLHDRDLAWWATQLAPNALRALERDWQGVFRRSILKLLPAKQIGTHFNSEAGRPSKELYSIAGLLFMAEFKNWTGEETAQAYSFDAGVQYALNMPRDRQYLSARSVDNYRKLFREDELAQGVFEEVTVTLVRELNLDIKKQRLDSTHVLSRMARLGRQQLLSTGVKRFLVQLEKCQGKEYEHLPEELRLRYQPAESRLFGLGTKKSQKKEEAIAQIGLDMAELIVRFAQHEAISAMKSFQSMKRLFEEHFEPPQDGSGPHRLRPKSITEDGSSARTLQNPSDEDAGYNGKKGAGYQAQISQALPLFDEQGKAEGPGIITAVLPQSASVRDNEAMLEVIEQQERTGLLPEELTADTLYGSDANVQYCAQQDITLTSPVGGKPPGTDEPKHSTTRKERELKERLAQRRQKQGTPEWKQRYAKRSGIEGLNRALDAVTGFKNLRVRGRKAVGMSLFLKAAGWNIMTAAKIRANRLRKAARRRLTRPYCLALAPICRTFQRAWGHLMPRFADTIAQFRFPQKTSELS